MGFTNSLPAEMAGCLRSSSGESSTKCGAVGVAGPVIAVLFGAVDGYAASEATHVALTSTVRREIRKLARMLEVPLLAGEDASPARKRANSTRSNSSISMFGRKDGAPPPDVFELALKWCTSPAVPSYEVGLHLALGDAQKSDIQQASSYAWILRLVCRRRNVDMVKIAPTIAAVAQALCESTDPSARLHELVNAAPRIQRRVSFNEDSQASMHPAMRQRSHTIAIANLGDRRS